MKKPHIKQKLKQLEKQLEVFQKMRADLDKELMSKAVLDAFQKFLYKNNRKVYLYFNERRGLP